MRGGSSNEADVPTPIDVIHERTVTGTARRIFQLLTELGTSQDAIWPFPSQPFMRSAGPLTPGVTEEWHGGIHGDAIDYCAGASRLKPCQVAG